MSHDFLTVCHCLKKHKSKFSFNFRHNMAISKHGNGPVGVLFIPPLMERKMESAIKALHLGQQSTYTFYSIVDVPYSHGAINFEALLECCRHIIRSEGIKVLYTNKAVPGLVAAILGEEFPHLLVPSVNSIFLCNHKYYTSVFVDSRAEPLPYTVRNISKDRFDIAYDLLKRFYQPAILRFALGSGHTIYKYKSRDQLLQVLAMAQRVIPIVIDQQRWLIKNYIDCTRYPLALEPVVLIQPFLDRLLSQGMAWHTVSIEACVCRKEIIPWAIVDGITLPYNHPHPTKFFCGSEMPTRLSILEQQILWKAFTSDIENLINEGFNNSFIHAEYMVFENGTVHLITMNSRPHAKCVHMYKHALVHGNNVKASLDLARGLRPRTPAFSGKYVLNYSLITFKSCRINDVFKFPNTVMNSHVHLNYSPGEEALIAPAQDFIVLGFITVPGENFAECTQEVKKIRNEILKKPRMIPFTE